MNRKGFYKNLLMMLYLMVVINVSLIFADTYYVDATDGNDNNGGRSPENAWKTIAMVNNSRFLLKDNILFKRGEVWEGGGNLDVISSGAYGSGD